MLLQNINLEFPGMGVALFSVGIFITLLLWKITFKTDTGGSVSVTGFLITGIIYGIFSAGFILTEGLDPMFYKNIGAVYDLMLVNLASLFMVLFNVLYIRKRTSKSGKAKGVLMILVYVIVALLVVVYVLNAFVKVGGQPIYNVLTPDGIVYNPKFYRLVMYLHIFIMFIPFIFVVQGWKRALPKERIILLVFALIPWIASVLKFMVYDKAELNADFCSYSILGILMVFFDQVQLDHEHQKQKQLAEKLAMEAMKDKLTGLISGDVFATQVSQDLAAKGSQGSCLAVISIDKYEEYARIYGRQFCEEILKKAANLLKEVVRADDLAGRISTEEFGVYFRCEVRYFDGLVCRMRDRLDFEHDGVAVSASIGAARVTDNDSDYDYILALADRTHRMAVKEGLGIYKLVNR
ncbi:MAG: GGDEF domain-containing protein [Blautia sp.]|nr:GGDEF domain-containing protein [Blautia sp.]